MAVATVCAQGAFAASVTAPEAGVDYYIQNAANQDVYLTYNTTNVVLNVASEAKYQRVQFVAVPDTTGIYHIRLADGMYLTTDGKWSTIMSNDAADPNTQVTIEAAGDNVKIKFVGTGKFLGSDDAADGKGIYTDKDGKEAKFQWVINAAPLISVPNAEKMYRIYNVKSGEYIMADGNYTRVAYANNNKQIFQLAAVDGKEATYTIKDDGENYLGADNSWNSVAISDASDVYAQWAISADVDHIYFKNQGAKSDSKTHSYLGCDSNNAGVWTDKNAADNVYTQFRIQEAIKGEPEIVFDPEAKNLLLNGDFQAPGWTPGTDVTDIPSWASYVSDNTENRDWIGNVSLTVDEADSDVALNMSIGSGCTWWGGYIGVEQEVELIAGKEYVLAFDYMFNNSKQASWHVRVVGSETLLDKGGNAVKTEMTQSLNKFTADTAKVKIQLYISNDFNQAAGATRTFTVDNVVLYDPNAEPENPDDPTLEMVDVNALSEIIGMDEGQPFTMKPTLLITHTATMYDEEADSTINVAYVYDDKTFGLILSGKAIGENQKNIVDGWQGVVAEDASMVPTSDLMIVDGHLELPTPTVLENGNFANVYPHQYVKLELVEFAESTTAEADEFTGKVGDKEITFFNLFKVAAQEAGVYSVVGYAEPNGTGYDIYPVEFEKQDGISSIETENAPVVYYNLQGLKVDAPAAGDIVIKVQGNTITKVVIR